jgi:phosphoribosylformimino-5-aminoimidazole carboxamide ribotide isomerase
MIDIIPAIDIIGGKCVRLTHGDFARKTVYADDPLEAAKRFAGLGLSRLHMVDLDGAKNGKPANLAVLELVASETDLVVDFGGGIKTKSDLENVYTAGAAAANIGSIAVKEPETFLGWVHEFGVDRILLGADCRNRKLAVNGWQTETEVSILDFLMEMYSKGVRKAFVTDISRDGAMNGPSIELYTQILGKLPDLDLIASGGVGSFGDVEALDRIGCSAVIVGKAIYEGRITDAELTRYAR